MDPLIDPFKIQEIKVATDAVCIAKSEGEEYILLIKRQYEPFIGNWALPGGFLQNNEELKDCAIRELKEETNIDHEITDIKQVGIYGAVMRDPRKRVISVAYLIQLDYLPKVSIANETLEVKWINLKELPSIQLAFDHGQIVDDALKVKRNES